MKTSKLTPNGVRQVVPSDVTGFYRLGFIRNGKFRTLYFGRSDSDLQQRLLTHAGKGWYDHFTFEVTNTIGEAYRLECRDWHLHGDRLRNHIHPARPDGTKKRCPYCGLEEHLESVIEEHNEIYTHV